MKASDRHKSAFESMARTLVLVTECLSKSKNMMRRYLKWLEKTVKMIGRLRKMAEDDIKLIDEKRTLLHPQIWMIQKEIFAKLKDVDSLQTFFGEIVILKTQEELEKCGKKCDGLTSSLKRFLVVLASSYEKLCGSVKRASEPSGTDVALESGFQHHCHYLKYFNDLATFEI